jgi:hypothetical protein
MCLCVRFCGARIRTLLFLCGLFALHPHERENFFCFFFSFRGSNFSISSSSFLSKRKPLSPRSFSSPFFASSETFVASHDGVPSHERRKKSVRVHLFSIFFFFLFFFFLTYSSLGYTHTRTYIYTHTHTHTHALYIHINNGIRNDQLFVDAVRRVVGLLFFLEKKFDDQQPIIRCF